MSSPCPLCKHNAVACADANAERGEGAEAELEALRAENAELLLALRAESIRAIGGNNTCLRCGEQWAPHQQERHRISCLARPR